MRPARITLVVVALVALACGREGPYVHRALTTAAPTNAPTEAPPAASPTPAPASTPTSAPATPAPTAAPSTSGALSEATLKNTLLTAAELPGWAAYSEGGDGEEAPDFEPCGEKAEQKHPSLRAAAAEFEKKDTFEFLSLSSESYRSVASAKASMQEARDQIARCPSWTATDDDGTKYTFHVQESSFTKVGDEVLGFAIHMVMESDANGTPFTAEAEGFAVGARIGQNAVGHFHMAIGFGSAPSMDKAETEAILKKAVEKFERLV